MDGPVLVMLHGQPGSGSDWLGVSALLPADVGWLVLDRPGYGGNPLPAGGFSANAAWLVDELAGRGIDDAVLVAHSWAAGVALVAATLAPDRVAGLVLVAGVGPDSVTGWDRLLAAPLLGPVLSVIAWSWTPLIARLRLAVLACRRGDSEARRRVNWQVWGRARGPVWRSFLIEQRALLRELPAVLTQTTSQPVALPVLLLHDPADALLPFSSALKLAGLLPDARVVRLEGGHQLPQRSPAPVAAALVGFLRQLSPGGQALDAVG